MKTVAMAAFLALMPVGVAGAQTSRSVCDPVMGPPGPVPATEFEAGKVDLPILTPGGPSISSPNGSYTLTFQGDGNLVFSRGDDVLWTSGTARAGGEQVVLQPDGTLAMSRTSTTIDGILWHSNSAGAPGAVLRVQNDGYVVIRSVTRNAEGARVALGDVRWSIPAPMQPMQREPVPVPATELAGATLVPGEWVVSPNGLHRLGFEEDGNLVFQRIESSLSSTLLWESDTAGDGDVITMQDDGNLVMRRGGTLEPVWHSDTAGSPKAKLRVQNDGYLVIQAVSGEVLWRQGSPIPAGPPPATPSTDVAANTRIYPAASDDFTSSAVVTSPNGCYVLRLGEDGNLVLYLKVVTVKADGGHMVEWQPVWQTATSYVRGEDLLARTEYAEMQSDGNFVLYQALPGVPGSQYAVFGTNTAGNPGAHLAVPDDGRLAVRDQDGNDLWARP